MIIRSIILLFIFNFSLNANETDIKNPNCNIELWSKNFIITKGEQVKLNQLFKETNCPLSVQNTFKKIFLKFDGNINSHYIENAFQEDFKPYKIKIQPMIIFIKRIETRLFDQLNIDDKSNKWAKLSLLSKKSILHLQDYEIPYFHCDNCNTPGAKRIKISISDPIHGNSRTAWITATLKTRTTVLKSIISQAVTYRGLDEKQFIKTTIFSENPEQYVKTLKNINFFKANKKLDANKALKINDISAMNLVKTGTSTRIIFKGKNLNLTSKAISKEQGKFGQFIKLKVLDSKKNIIGKVIDYNKVLIEL
jgi:flagella basal body P-ring formation protein FlgA